MKGSKILLRVEGDHKPSIRKTKNEFLINKYIFWLWTINNDSTYNLILLQLSFLDYLLRKWTGFNCILLLKSKNMTSKACMIIIIRPTHRKSWVREHPNARRTLTKHLILILDKIVLDSHVFCLTFPFLS